MTVNILCTILFGIFSSLGLIHFYWVVGGKWGLNNALPAKENGVSVLNPTKIATSIVGIVLISFGLFYLIQLDLINIQLPGWVIAFGGWVIPSVFLLRAIGDFNYIGFFKKIKNTTFAKADSIFFSPLCFTIWIIGMLIQLIK